MTVTVISNATIFDGENAELIEGGVVIDQDRIREVGGDADFTGEAVRLDAGGRFLMPGLIDTHFHANTPSYDFYGSDRMPPELLAAHAFQILEGALQRGFTTLRDAGGGNRGLWLAIERGLVDGPRFFYPGKAITQTGGHGDMRRRDEIEPCACAYSGHLTRALDGADAIRHAIREEFRKGASQIKIFLSGGVSTDLAPIWMPHFSDEEIRCAVEEASRRRSYVMAHCHTDEGAKRCVELGIRTIEHGSMIKSDTAKMIADAGVFVVPTLSARRVIARNAQALGLPASTLDRIAEVGEQNLAAIEACQAAGVKMGLGCDLHGFEFTQDQGRELALRGEAQRPIDVLRSATSINAEIVQMAGELGVIRPGALADIILVDRSPLDDLSVFIDALETISLVMKGGRIVRTSL